MSAFHEKNETYHHQTQHFQQSLWLHQLDQREIADLNKRQQEECSMSSSKSFSEVKPTRLQRRSQKIIYQNQVIFEQSENSTHRESNMKFCIQIDGQNDQNYKEFNQTFQKSMHNHRNKEVSFEKNNLNKESSINEQLRGSIIASPVKRLDSSRRHNKSRPANVQKELLNKFMQIYQKQKPQLTKLDVIVKLKTKLKNFFINYTYQGRTYLLNENYLIRKFIREKNDILAFSKEDKSKFNKKFINNALQNQK
ncbi:hypothetical protein ABPG72_001373 [Tetrahymena utriculariae]